MNEIANTFLYAGDRFIPEFHLREPEFAYSACGPFTQNKEKYKNLQKQEIQDIFMKKNQINLVFSITWLMEI